MHALKRRDPAVAVVIRSDYGGTVAPILPLLTSGYTGLAYVAKSSPREVLDDAISYALRQDIFFSVRHRPRSDRLVGSDVSGRT